MSTSFKMNLASFIRDYASGLSQVASAMITSGVVFIILFTSVFFMLRILLIQRRKKIREQDGKYKASFAFFHPYCNAGGGGERVLWVAIRALQKRYPDIRCVVYSGDIDASEEEILAKVRQRFNIVLPRRVQFVFLNYRHWVEAVKYPYFTLLGQSIGSLVLGFEALFKFVPDIYIDSMGYAFTIPLFKYLGGCSVACYVHYPTISTDMLTRVSERVQAHNNASFISRSPLLSNCKLLYYRLFAYMYGVAGGRCSIVMVNSTWTYNHIVQLWNVPAKTSIIYPPCDTTELMTIPLTSDENKVKQILSLGQFRPEKDHPLQINAFDEFLKNVPKHEQSQYKLVLAGSCRNSGDENRVKTLQRLVEEKGIQHCVEFRLNISFTELKELLAESMISIHTMWNEHFGICVVEAMAAGNIMLAHNSGGPMMDIVVNHNEKPTGYLASDSTTYAQAMKTIFALTPDERLELRRNARESMSRFSEDEFESGFLSLLEPTLKNFDLIGH